jgi:signal transduction histidine kinase
MMGTDRGVRRKPFLRVETYLLILLASIVASFVASTWYTQHRLQVLDRESFTITDNAAPSIDHLTAIRSEVKRLEFLAFKGVDQPEGASESLRQSRAQIVHDAEAYLALPTFPGEEALWADARVALERLDASIDRALRVARSDPAGARRIVTTDVERLVGDAGEALDRCIRLNAQGARRATMVIRENRSRSRLLAFGLHGLSICLAIAGVLVIRRVQRAHADLARAHEQLREVRMRDLEDFAGRLAHDVYNPIHVVMMCIVIARETEDRVSREAHLDRARAALLRMQELTDGMLDFARAGAPAPESARTAVSQVVADVASGFEPEALLRHIDLRVQPADPVAVCARVGVLVSLISNLVRNAIKYMGDATDRWIEIRVRSVDKAVRIEVEDSGPGLTPEVESKVFAPYVRKPGAKEPGIGLGLATVKRMAEAHGGRVGVRSSAGHGAMFWFELPRAF